MDDDWADMALVGRVARAQGHRGQVIVDPETDFPEARFCVGQRLFLRIDERVDARRITAVRFQGARPVLTLEGIENMNAAERLSGAQLRVPIAQLAALPHGMFYRHDLVGCRVLTRSGTEVGIVGDVQGRGDATRLVVSGDRGEIQVPLAAEICVELAPTRREIVIEPPEGLLELNTPEERRRP